MDTGSALLAAIIDEPDSDTHRLVFADWLDEQGRGQWAALIRSQCSLERLVGPLPPFSDDSGVRATSLRPEVRLEVLGCLRGLIADEDLLAAEPTAELRYIHGRVRRGFLDQLRLHGGHTVERFIEHAGSIFQHTPLLHLCLSSNAPPARDLDIASGYLYQAPPPIISLANLESLLRVPSFGRLRTLDLRPLYLSGTWTRMLHRLAHVFQSTHLLLHGHQIGNARRARRLQDRFGDRLLLDPPHPGDAALNDEIPF
jgi:uncharacterized protein (TIGR02996 family)